MAGTYLEIVQQACQELGLAAPEQVVGSTDLQTIQMGALVNTEGDELRQRKDDGWTELQSVYVITVGPAITTTGTITTGSTTITGIPTTAALSAGIFSVAGNGLNQATRVVTVASGTSVTINMPATANGTISLTFVQDTFAEPSDFDSFISETWWDRTNHWMLLGPDSPQIDEWHLSGIVTTGPRRHFRQVGRLSATGPTGGKTYRLWPPISTNESNFSIAFEYVSKNWVVATDGSTYKSSMTVDTDISCLDKTAVVKGLKWRFWQIKGLDYAPLQAEYLDYVDRLVAKDGGNRTLGLANLPESIYISPWQVPDGNWPGQS